MNQKKRDFSFYETLRNFAPKIFLQISPTIIYSSAMILIESSNITDLIFNDETYHLNIKTECKKIEGEQPANIYLSIVIVKILANKKYQSDNLQLVYTLCNRTYSALDKLNELSALLYKNIIDKLDDTFGDTWGCENQ